MRVISGKHKGRPIFAAADLSIRPTTDRVKSYIFNVLRDFPEGRNVLDLFSGSGNLGIEALSRGAARITFVDKSYRSLKVLAHNVDRLGVGQSVQAVRQDVLAFLAHNFQPFDLIFADPPFHWGRFDELLPLIFNGVNLAQEGIFVLESERAHQIVWESDCYQVIQQKKFDRSIITFFAGKDPNENSHLSRNF